MGWSMHDKEYASWKNAVNKKLVMDYLMFRRKKTAGYNYGGMKNKGRIRLTSTAQYGDSRFLVGIGIYFGKPKKKETFIYNSS